MSMKIKTGAIIAAIVLLLAAVAAVMVFGKDDSGDYEKRLESAALYLENCDYDNAIAIYNGIIAEDRTCAEAYAGLSEAYYAINRADKAMEVLEKGLDSTDGDDIVMSKWNELFPDVKYAEGEDHSVPEGALDGTELSIDGITTVTSDTSEETETSEAAAETTETTEETEETTETTTEVTSETTVPTTTTAVTTTTVTTAAPVTTTAAPVWTNPPVTTTVPRTTAATTVPTTTTTVTTTVLRDVTIKDFTTMSLDEAYSWCSKNNIILTVIGNETDESGILSQSPAPGSVVKENSEIIVVLDS